MKIEKLAKQLRRDLVANPKRSALLGLMVLVALYFWAPLVTGWLIPAKPRKTVIAKDGPTVVDDSPSAKQPKTASKKQLRWEQLAVQMAGDPRMKPLAAVVDRDPFRWIEAPQPEVSPADALLTENASKSIAPVIKPTAVNLGLKLESIIVSSRGHTAMINGRVLREGDSLEIQAAQEEAIVATVVTVSHDSVQLNVEGEPVIVELSRPALASGDELRRKPTGSP